MKLFSERQHKAPTSVKLWSDQAAEIDWACERLGITRSRLLRSAALTVAKELRAGAERPLQLTR